MGLPVPGNPPYPVIPTRPEPGSPNPPGNGYWGTIPKRTKKQKKTLKFFAPPLEIRSKFTLYLGQCPRPEFQQHFTDFFTHNYGLLLTSVLKYISRYFWKNIALKNLFFTNNPVGKINFQRVWTRPEPGSLYPAGTRTLLRVFSNPRFYCKFFIPFISGVELQC